MAKDSNRRAGSFEQSGGGAFSGLLAEEEEFDRRALWRLGTWAAASVCAVIIAILANQSTIGIRKELTASADLVRQAQQLQLTARDNLAETRRLTAAVETLNGDRDRLYARVGVLEQGLDSVTGAITRQNSLSSPVPSNTSTVPPAPAPVANAASAGSSPGPAVAAVPASAAPVAPAVSTAVDSPPPPVAKPPIVSVAPPPVATPVASTAVAADKPSSKPAPPESQAALAPISAPVQRAQEQMAVSLVAPKSMMGPPDPAATKLIETPAQSKAVTSAPIPEVTAALAKIPDNEATPETSATAPELAVRRTEFGVDIGGANSIPGLRALWRGLLKSRSNAALATLHPVIVIKENSNGLGMQLRLVAGPIGDAAAAAKLCATLTVSERACTTAVFEGQRLVLNPEDQVKPEAEVAPEATSANEAKPGAAKGSSHRHYGSKRVSREETTEQPSTLSSLIFGRR